MTDAYAEHLAGLHASFAAPREMIVAAAREVTASPLMDTERLVHGEANEVYRLAFENGVCLILRIARRGEGRFEKEAFAIGRCRALGVAAPEVLSIQTRETTGAALELCFMERIAGERLSDRSDLPREVLREIVREVGDQLSRIHTIGAEDLGEGARLFADDTDDFLALRAEFESLGVEAGLAPRALDRAFAAYERTLGDAAAPPRRVLTHNDLRACHVMVHEGRLSGLIDFGEVSLDSPINEFAKWDYWEAPDLPVGWLREGYRHEGLFDADFAPRFEALRIANALWALRWYALTAFRPGVARAVAKLEGYLAEAGMA